MVESSIQADLASRRNLGLRSLAGSLASPDQSAPALFVPCSTLEPSSLASPGTAGGDRRFLADPSPEPDQTANRRRGEARFACQRIVHLSQFTHQILGTLARRRTAIQCTRGAGDGIRIRDIQIGSAIGLRPAYAIALTGLRRRFRSRTSPARLLSPARQMCVQQAPSYTKWPNPEGRPRRRVTSGPATSPSALEARGRTTIGEQQRHHCVAALSGHRSLPPSDPGDESPFEFPSAGSDYRRRQSRMRPSRGPALTADSPSVWAGPAPGAVTSRMNTSVATITTGGRRPGPVIVPCPATDASGRFIRLDASGCTPISIHRTASTPVCLVRIPNSPRTYVQKTCGSRRSQQLDSGDSFRGQRASVATNRGKQHSREQSILQDSHLLQISPQGHRTLLWFFELQEVRRVGNDLTVDVRIPVVERRVARVLCGGVRGYDFDRTPHGAEIDGHRIR